MNDKTKMIFRAFGLVSVIMSIVLIMEAAFMPGQTWTLVNGSILYITIESIEWTFVLAILVACVVFLVCNKRGKHVQKSWHFFCEHCANGFSVDGEDVKWVEEQFNTKLGYHTWKASIYCSYCGIPTSIWKRD